jgi:hypothetical protein
MDDAFFLSEKPFTLEKPRGFHSLEAARSQA